MFDIATPPSMEWRLEKEHLFVYGRGEEVQEEATELGSKEESRCFLAAG